jgi:hypothetical protein
MMRIGPDVSIGISDGIRDAETRQSPGWNSTSTSASLMGLKPSGRTEPNSARRSM